MFISCRGLKNLNNLYISDPQVFIYEEKDHQKKLLGHTEVIRKNLNPDFTTTIRTNYFFNRNQELLIEVNDANESVLGKVTELALKGERKETFIGGVKTTLSKLMGSPNCISKLDIYRDTHHNGKVIIFIDKVRT